MIKNYLKMAWRNLTKNKVSSFINIGGLSIGLATGIVIIMVIAHETSFDKFHKNIGSTYQLMKNAKTDNQIFTGSNTPGPLAEHLRHSIPEIKYIARVTQGGREMLTFNDKSYYEKGIWADPEYFDMMSFEVVEGNPSAALKEPGSVVITERTAKKFFGPGAAVGKMLMHDNKHSMKVAAVIKDIPDNSSRQFDVALPMRLHEQENRWVKKWDDERMATIIQTTPNPNIDALNRKISKVFLSNTTDSTASLFAYPMAAMRLHGGFKNGKPSGGAIEILTLLGCVAGFVLLIACINFMNLATARAARRALEVGVRKVMGASRKLIIAQFMSEAIVMSFVALALGFLIAVLVLPGFMRLTGRYFTPDFTNPTMWSLLIGLGLITGLIAGSYPAFYLSRFQPIKVLKKLVSPGSGGSMLRKGLVTFQFVLSIFLITTTIVIYRQINHIQERPMGYQPDNLIDINASGELAKNFELIQNEFSKIGGVKEVTAGSDDLVSYGGTVTGMEYPEKPAGSDFPVVITWAKHNWIKTVGFTMAEGREFDKSFGTDTAACLLNEAAVERMKLKNPIGAKVGGAMVIGVVKDFVFNNPSASPKPMVIYYASGNVGHIFVRIENNDKWRSTVAEIEKVAKGINPGFPFDFKFTKDEYKKRFQQIKSIATMTNVFGVMAIIISCLGLFGLSAFVAERRRKEVSIRKVLGATVQSIWMSLSKYFMKPVVIAFLIATPISVFVMDMMLQEMDYRIGLSWWMFALAGLLVLVVAIVTVSINGVKAALANPVESLKAE